MKKCPKCATVFDERFLFCPDDGATLLADSSGLDRTPTEPQREQSANLPALVLSCSACSSEYPPTFLTCPIDQAPLLRAERVSNRAGASDHRRPMQNNPLQPESTQPESNEILREGDDESTLEATPPSIEIPEPAAQRSFTITAAIIAASLVVVSATVVILVVSGFHRRPAAPVAVAEAASASDAQSEIFVPTPEAALSYSEKPQVEGEQRAEVIKRTVSATRNEPRPEAPKSKVNSSARYLPPSVEQLANARAPLPQLPQSPRRTSFEPGVVADAPSSRFAEGLIGAHLVKSTSARTAQGVRYELTFNLTNQSNRQSFLRSLTINTRSGYGATRTQSLAFPHRLAPGGTLTFTIGVEMTGGTVGDWRGYVSVLTAGYDAEGSPLRARFAAPLAP